MGRFAQGPRTAAGLRQAISYFERAIALDSTFAEAFAGLADSHFLLANYGYLPPSESFPLGKAAAQRAVELDPFSGAAFTSLAWAEYIFEWRWEAAEEHFRKAIELGPDYARAHQWYAGLLNTLGRFNEALLHGRRAQELDPLSPGVAQTLAWILLASGRAEDAVQHLQELASLKPDVPLLHRDLGLAYVAAGSYDRAVREFAVADSLAEEGTMYRAWLGFACGLVGDSARAYSILDDLMSLAEAQYVPSMEIAQVLLGLGDKDRAFQWLDQALGERDDHFLRTEYLPLFDPIRDDPRFVELVRRVGLPD